MGRRQPLSTPKAAKSSARSRCGWRPLRPDLCRVSDRPTPHWCHIPPALFRLGKGLWSQFESRNAVDEHPGASANGAPSVRRVVSGRRWDLG